MTKNTLTDAVAETLKPGTKLELTNTRFYGLAEVGAKAVVGPRGFCTSLMGSKMIDIEWTEGPVFGQKDGLYYPYHFSVVVEAKEPTAPMTKLVLDLLRRKGAITALEAQGVLRCRQLPARVLELKRLGHKIITEMKVDPTGQKYARYHLMAA